MSIESDDNFIYEDGLGHLLHRQGIKVMILHVNNVGPPLKCCMAFRDSKMLTKNCDEKSKKEVKNYNQQSSMDIDQIRAESKRKCLGYSSGIKQKFYEMKAEKGFSILSCCKYSWS